MKYGYSSNKIKKELGVSVSNIRVRVGAWLHWIIC
jgi:hypothetical protein